MNLEQLGAQAARNVLPGTSVEQVALSGDRIGQALPRMKERAVQAVEQLGGAARTVENLARQGMDQVVRGGHRMQLREYARRQLLAQEQQAWRALQGEHSRSETPWRQPLAEPRAVVQARNRDNAEILQLAERLAGEAGYFASDPAKVWRDAIRMRDEQRLHDRLTEMHQSVQAEAQAHAERRRTEMLAEHTRQKQELIASRAAPAPAAETPSGWPLPPATGEPPPLVGPRVDEGGGGWGRTAAWMLGLGVPAALVLYWLHQREAERRRDEEHEKHNGRGGAPDREKRSSAMADGPFGEIVPGMVYYGSGPGSARRNDRRLRELIRGSRELLAERTRALEDVFQRIIDARRQAESLRERGGDPSEIAGLERTWQELADEPLTQAMAEVDRTAAFVDFARGMRRTWGGWLTGAPVPEWTEETTAYEPSPIVPGVEEAARRQDDFNAVAARDDLAGLAGRKTASAPGFAWSGVPPASFGACYPAAGFRWGAVPMNPNPVANMPRLGVTRADTGGVQQALSKLGSGCSEELLQRLRRAGAAQMGVSALGALLGGIYGATEAPEGREIQSVGHGAGRGLGAGLGVLGGGWLGAGLGSTAALLSQCPGLAALLAAGGTVGGAALGGLGGWRIGERLLGPFPRDEDKGEERRKSSKSAADSAVAGGMDKRAWFWPLLGGIYGAAHAPEGKEIRSIGHGAARGLGVDLGARAGGGLGFVLGRGLATSELLRRYPGLAALLIGGGTVGGAVTGGLGGFGAADWLMGPFPRGEHKKKEKDDDDDAPRRELKYELMGKSSGDADLNPYQSALFSRCLQAGMDEGRIRRAIDAVHEKFGADVSGELYGGLEKISGWGAAKGAILSLLRKTPVLGKSFGRSLDRADELGKAVATAQQADSALAAATAQAAQAPKFTQAAQKAHDDARQAVSDAPETFREYWWGTSPDRAKWGVPVGQSPAPLPVPTLRSRAWGAGAGAVRAGLGGAVGYAGGDVIPNTEWDSILAMLGGATLGGGYRRFPAGWRHMAKSSLLGGGTAYPVGTVMNWTGVPGSEDWVGRLTPASVLGGAVLGPFGSLFPAASAVASKASLPLAVATPGMALADYTGAPAAVRNIAGNMFRPEVTPEMLQNFAEQLTPEEMQAVAERLPPELREALLSPEKVQEMVTGYVADTMGVPREQVPQVLANMGEMARRGAGAMQMWEMFGNLPDQLLGVFLPQETLAGMDGGLKWGIVLALLGVLGGGLAGGGQGAALGGIGGFAMPLLLSALTRGMGGTQGAGAAAQAAPAGQPAAAAPPPLVAPIPPTPPAEAPVTMRPAMPLRNELDWQRQRQLTGLGRQSSMAPWRPGVAVPGLPA